MPSPRPRSSRSMLAGFFYAALAAALWSVISPLSRILYDLHLSAMEAAFWRALISGCSFTLACLAGHRLRVPVRDALLMLGLGGAAGSMVCGGLQVSIACSGGATAVVLLYTAPAWVAILARIFFQEAITPARLTALVTALAGVVMVSMSGGSSTADFSPLGVFCGLLAGFGYASFFPITSWFTRRYSFQTIYAFAFLGTALVLFPLSLPHMEDKSAEIWGLLVLSSVLSSTCAYTALAMSLRYLSQVQSAVTGNIEPVLGTLWVWLFFGENFTPVGWLGCALIMAAVFLLTLEKRPDARSA